MVSSPYPLLPPARLGILGGGQLALMFTAAAQKMGYLVSVVDPDPNAPARRIADEHLCLPYHDERVFLSLKKCRAVTVEFENVDVKLMSHLETAGVRVAPAAAAVAVSQNRITEKAVIKEAGLAVVPYQVINGLEDIAACPQSLFPGILKTATLGYDGKGQITVTSRSELEQGFSVLGRVPCVLEKKLELKSEASVIVARRSRAEAVTYPVVENKHQNGILVTAAVPAALSPAVSAALKVQALQLAEHLNYIGVMAVEFFVVNDHIGIYVNETAPRPHNSGHYTVDACLTSQFEQQVRILCDLPPASCRLLSPAVMVNLLGDLWGNRQQPPDWQVLLAQQAVKLCLYGKKSARPGRKMGHFTVLAASTATAREQGLKLLAQLTKGG